LTTRGDDLVRSGRRRVTLHARATPLDVVIGGRHITIRLLPFDVGLQASGPLTPPPDGRCRGASGARCDSTAGRTNNQS